VLPIFPEPFIPDPVNHKEASDTCTNSLPWICGAPTEPIYTRLTSNIVDALFGPYKHAPTLFPRDPTGSRPMPYYVAVHGGAGHYSGEDEKEVKKALRRCGRALFQGLINLIDLPAITAHARRL